MAFLPIYILILGFTIVVDYYAGICIEKAEGRGRKRWLIASLVANIGVLAAFKYYNFLNQNLTELLGIANIVNPLPTLAILLPIGLSFHTFQAMSYTIEVYRGNQKAERNFGIYALYVMFFPQLVAGPIERPQNLLHQFYEKHSFDFEKVVSGLKQILWGFFMKLVVADRLAIYVNSVYNNVPQHTGTTLLVATIFFSFQIYCDFAGYSNIAIGTARIMGFHLMTNFNRPYLSRSISEFWKRWHISLSTWFRDYLYITLGGNRVAIPRWYLNLFIVFVVSGLWHGANWTYIIWGALNGMYLIFAIVTVKWRNRISHLIYLDRLPRLQNIVLITTTFALASFAWIFFRANTVQNAWLIISKIATLKGSLFIGEQDNMLYCILAILILILSEVKLEYFKNKYPLMQSPNLVVRYLVYAGLALYIGLFGVFDGGQFIYFQF